MNKPSTWIMTALLGASLSGCYSEWKNADTFTAKLQCGMTQSQVIKLAESLGAEARPVQDKPNYVHVVHAPDVFLVFVNEQKQLFRADRMLVKYHIGGMQVTQAGLYEVLSCSKQ